jgi:hypothetical protein
VVFNNGKYLSLCQSNVFHTEHHGYLENFIISTGISISRVLHTSFSLSNFHSYVGKCNV